MRSISPWGRGRRTPAPAAAPAAPAPADTAAAPAPAPAPDPFPGLAALLPEGERRAASKPRFLARLRSCVHPGFYLAQVADDEAAVLGAEPAVDAVIEHYVRSGARAGLRPCALFHPGWYADRAAERGIELGDAVPFLHWLTVGWRERVVPTPLFDADYYFENNPPVQKLTERNPSTWVFEHYLTVGCYQPRWAPSPYGAHHSGAKSEEDSRRDPLMLPELLHRADEQDLTRTSWLEEGVLAVRRQHDRLTTSPVLREMFERAAEAEPLIGTPRHSPRIVTSAVHRNPRLRVVGEVDAALREIGTTPVDTVILVPHCRMGGAARVSGIFAHAVAAVAPGERALVIGTDDAAFERPDWFPADIQVLDLTAFTAGMRPQGREDVLLDLLRELAPKRTVIINSRLGWKAVTHHGSRLSEVTRLGAYLFTWELNSSGYKGGYPIREFERCFEHLAWVMFDSDRLRQEVAERFALPPAARERLLLARTPIDPPGLDVAGVTERRRAAGEPLRAFWAGRFDRQKRFDLVVEVARRMPHLEVWAWGKAVLNDVDVDLDDLPTNIRLMGTYTDFDELPLDQLDLMLYTAQWDGIPTLLLDVALAGLPVVASAVGGVPEVITEETGYPVVDALEPAAYVAAIERLVADPAEAVAKAAAVRKLIARDFDLGDYRRIVADALEIRRSEP